MANKVNKTKKGVKKTTNKTVKEVKKTTNKTENAKKVDKVEENKKVDKIEENKKVAEVKVEEKEIFDEKLNKEEKKKNEKEEKKQYKEKSLFSRVMNVVLWIILFVWIAICITDYYRLTTKKEPIFCLKEEVTEYDDGKVYSCLGIGYKTYKYERASYNAIQFGPFWIGDRSNEEIK